MYRYAGAVELALALDPDDSAPLFLRIAHAIAEDVQRGRLRAGARLPGSRKLAQSLGVHRNTVVAAYEELTAEGWLTTKSGGGTFVSDALPDPPPRRFSRRARAGVPAKVNFDLPPPIALPPSVEALPRGTLALWGGTPDLRLVPITAIARAHRRALSREGARLLAYSDSHGHPALRAAVAGWVSATRGIAATPESVLVTRGSQMAIDLVAKTLITPGHVVAVEELGYRPAWAALERAGAELVPLPIDRDGLSTHALERLCETRAVRAVYVTPHHHYPTTVVMSPQRRMGLLELAERFRFAILEDDYDHEFHYDGRPLLPLASADVAGSVVYVGTLSKILAPGLRLGFVVAPPDLVERLARERFVVDRQGDLVLESAVAELMQDGVLDHHARRMRGIYRERRDALVSSLRKRLGSRVEVAVPAGGMALWVHAPAIDVSAWKRRALAKQVAFMVARDFTFHRTSRPYLRLGFASLDPEELDEAVRRMAASLKG